MVMHNGYCTLFIFFIIARKNLTENTSRVPREGEDENIEPNGCTGFASGNDFFENSNSVGNSSPTLSNICEVS